MVYRFASPLLSSASSLLTLWLTVFFPSAIQADDVLTIELTKSDTQRWWPHVLTHHPKIDTTKLTPENSKLSDLDGAPSPFGFAPHAG